MKRTICILLVMILVFGTCAGCGKKGKKKTDAKQQDKIETETDVTVEEDVLNDTSEEGGNTEQQPVTGESNAEQQQSQNQSQNKNQNQQKQQVVEQQTQPVVVNPTITASTTNVSLDNSAQTIYVTISHAELGVLTPNIADTSLISIAWGNWNGLTIPLTISPLKTGSTTIVLNSENYNKSVTINVTSKITTPADLSSLTIDKVGNTYERWFHGTAATNKFVLNSAEYKITSRNNGNVDIHIDLTTSCVECNYSSYYIQILYELYNSSGVCIKSHYIFKQFTHLNQLYSNTIDFYDLAPGDYTLKFMSGY